MRRKIHPWYVYFTTVAFLALLLFTALSLDYLKQKLPFIPIKVPRVDIFSADSQKIVTLDTTLTRILAEIEHEIDIVDTVDHEPRIIYSFDTVMLSPQQSAPSKSINTETLNKVVFPLQYPPGKPDLLFFFYHALNTESKKRTIRILHYGDSQIEGDRISGFLRHRFQSRFGGSGPGLLSCNVPIAQHATIEQFVEGNWRHQHVMQSTESQAGTLSYGIMGQTSYFTDQPPKFATIRYKLSGLSYPTARGYNWVRLFLGKSETPLAIELYGKDTLILADSFVPDEELNVFGFVLPYTPTDITFRFRSRQSPNFYAIALDATTGITVDNIAWRGSSGAHFSKIDELLLQYFFHQLNVRLIIFQFGVNVVKNVTKEYRWYEDLLVAQLEHLRKAAGDIPIIVVGVSDMSQKVEGGYQSYPNIPAIRDAQRNAAFRTGCVYWDTYEAMGGKNSMPAWVFANPPLANKDFVHFNARGNKIIAQMLYQAIMKDYEIFANNK